LSKCNCEGYNRTKTNNTVINKLPYPLWAFGFLDDEL
jgi:hypothetical protein